MKLVVKQNTYPRHQGVQHAEKGDVVEWRLERGAYHLYRIGEDSPLFVTAPVDKKGRLQSNGKLPPLFGVVAQIKCRGWVLELEHEREMEEHVTKTKIPKWAARVGLDPNSEVVRQIDEAVKLARERRLREVLGEAPRCVSAEKIIAELEKIEK